MVYFRGRKAQSRYAQRTLYRLSKDLGMAQKPAGVDVLPGLHRRRHSYSRQPVGAPQAGESRMHPHSDVRRESVFRFDTGRNTRTCVLMTKEEARAKFAEMAARNESDLELDRAALLIAAEEYPRLDVQKYLNQIDSFAEMAGLRGGLYADPLSRILLLRDLLFGELGFRGNVEEYFDARNSFLNDVIDRRAGIPITLSVLFIEIARRIELKILGVGLPGHFIVKFADHEQEILIDPFNGGRLLTEEKCREMIEEMYRGQLEFHPSFLYAVTKKQILARMLQNLKGIYWRASDHHKTLGAIERGLLIHSEMGADGAADIRDRGFVYSGMGRYVMALSDLEEYLKLAPQAPDAKEIEEQIRRLRNKLARLN